jgi:predicted molibdopterin-dependent oxidoreductase YjgC
VLPVLEERLGVFAATNSMDEMNYADFLLLVGCDITVESPISGIKIKSAIRKGAKVAEIGSRRTALSRLADKTLLVKSGKELALIKGIIRAILDEKLTDSELLESYSGLDELRMSVLERDTKTIAEDVGVGAEEITELARNLMSARNASVAFGEAVALTPDGPAIINVLIDLLMLTGKMGQEGFGLYPVVSATNFQGAVDMGVSPAHLPGHVSLEKKKERSKFDKAWKTEVPVSQGLTAHQMLRTAAEGKLGALYVVGVDLAGSFPGGKTTSEALSEIDFLVVQDLFMTETARRADVVLPASALAEKNGTLTNMERRIQRTRKTVDGPGRSMPDWRIFSELGVALGDMEMKYINAAEVLDEIAETVLYYSGINHRILSDNGLQWPFTKEDAKEIYHEGYLGTRHLLGEGPDEKLRKFSAVSSWGETAPDPDYPYTLFSGEVLFHSGTYTRYSDSLNSLIAESLLLMNSQTGAGLGIEEGGLVTVVSVHGELTVKSKFSDDLMEDNFFLPRHFADAPAGRLMGTDGDNTETAVVRVRVQRA